MAHLRRFEGIPMSKTMRGICKEEDYAFLCNLEDAQPQAEEDARPMDEEKRERHEERIRRMQERAQREEERKRELEEKRKQKEEEWKKHVAELAAEREAAMQERALRLRDFRCP
ncbi:U2 small nuclear ribonucleoprotein auxiliary factor 35 kDa subunit-related protein 1-like [Megalops cyprinoides]|uniref:U2 small nuclear ribonucleoprotein auxiliary factor 35 kDa subunit-related protein 1-like n=1 Tax=Megalops cyprinoides TaxID=118141 RepID=UPI00186466A2|nr:U2 small nuclear ribonucleoprotein auxiliary factor 35 kDa subunit-related protein 1-like [Megalops cyprinoides]